MRLSDWSRGLKAGAALVVSLFLTEVVIVSVSPVLVGRRLYEYSMISLFAITGATVGWFLGIVLSPRDHEDKRFSIVTSAIATFFSGFLVSKLNSGFDWFLRDQTPMSGMPDRPTVLIRTTFAIAWFMIALTITFLTRIEEATASPKSSRNNTTN